MRILFQLNPYSQQRQKEKPSHIYPVLMAMQATYFRNQGYEVLWNEGKKEKGDLVVTDPGDVTNLPFLKLPRPDRVFTRAKEFTSGNYKYLPGTHTQVANGCWHGKCTFCVENNGQAYEVRELEDYLQEIEECKSLGFKEVFDDSATLPTGKWLDDFCKMASGTIPLGCNMRICNSVDFLQMKKANFRMLLFGIESANQITLDKINKGVKVEDIIPTIKRASDAGIEPHITVMFGFPWETDTEALNTLRLVHYLLRKGYAKTAQASFYCPQKETPAGQEGQKVQESHRKYVRQIYNVGYDPRFWLTVLRSTRTGDDLKYLWRKIKKGIARD